MRVPTWLSKSVWGAITDSELGFHVLGGGVILPPVLFYHPARNNLLFDSGPGGGLCTAPISRGKGRKAPLFFVFSPTKPSGVKTSFRAQNWPAGFKPAFGLKTNLRVKIHNMDKSRNRPSGLNHKHGYVKKKEEEIYS